MYASVDQLRNHLGEDRFLALVDRDHDGEPDTAAVADALADASGRADSYIARWLPLSPAPRALVSAVLHLATYDLAGNRCTEDERKRAEDAVAWLRDLSAGRASLGAPAGAGPEILTSTEEIEHSVRQTRRIL